MNNELKNKELNNEVKNKEIFEENKVSDFLKKSFRADDDFFYKIIEDEEKDFLSRRHYDDEFYLNKMDYKDKGSSHKILFIFLTTFLIIFLFLTFLN